MEEEKQASSKSLLMNEGTENSPTEEDILVLKEHLLDIKYIEFEYIGNLTLLLRLN